MQAHPERRMDHPKCFGPPPSTGFVYNSGAAFVQVVKTVTSRQVRSFMFLFFMQPPQQGVSVAGVNFRSSF